MKYLYEIKRTDEIEEFQFGCFVVCAESVEEAMKIVDCEWGIKTIINGNLVWQNPSTPPKITQIGIANENIKIGIFYFLDYKEGNEHLYERD